MIFDTFGLAMGLLVFFSRLFRQILALGCFMCKNLRPQMFVFGSERGLYSIELLKVELLAGSCLYNQDLQFQVVWSGCGSSVASSWVALVTLDP